MATATVPRGKAAATGANQAAARSNFYAHLARAFAFPGRAFHAEVSAGSWQDEQAALVAALPRRLTAGRGSWRAPDDYDRFQSEYIRLFEVGPRGAASTPLYGGHYTRDRLRTMEELVRFYNFFGLRLSPGLMPDHVTVELEFMHFLAFKESEARASGEDVSSYLRAQRDFLRRQLGAWWPILTAALKRHRPLPFYRSLVALLVRFIEAERVYLDAALTGR